jgi:beta-lactamase class A
MPHLTRRAWLASAAATALCTAHALPVRAAVEADFATLESAHGGRLGVAAFDIASGARLGYRAAERFPMCSTHKVLSAAAVLTAVERGRLRLDQRIPYGRADLLSYAPITKAHVADGSMTLGALCAAAIDWSDNTAANLLLAQIGGPQGWTRYARSIGDDVSRLDRTEPTLNSAVLGDPRDTTTPNAMLSNLDTLLLGQALTPASRKQLEDWMLASSITGALIKAGVPKTWRVGDKSGSGDNGTRNDVGIILRPQKAPILATIYYTASPLDMSGQNKVVAATAAIIAARFGG